MENIDPSSLTTEEILFSPTYRTEASPIKAEAVSLWGNVILRARNDIILLMRKLQDEERPSEQEWYNAFTAYNFLFTDNYTVPLEDCYCDITCTKCDDIWMEKLSILHTMDIITCPLCKEVTPWAQLKYKISEDQPGWITEITLPEILSIWDWTNIKGFRKHQWSEICKFVKSRAKALQTRRDRQEKEDEKNNTD